jgi:phosphohistidine swiveling domain-containing protein
MSTVTAAPGLLDATDALSAGEGRVGGKAMGLTRLERVGANVPWWVVLPAEAFTQHLAAAGLVDLVREELLGLTPDRAQEVGARLAAAVRSAPMDPATAAMVEAAVAGRYPLAVRSSVVGEDSAAASHAGLFDSYLFLDDAQAVLDAVVRCWASAFNPRALAYRLERGGPVEPPTMGVIVQRAVEGEVSGVLFTSNPVSGRDDEALVSSCWGLGEGVVSGRCDADELVWNHHGRELSATTVTKDIHVVRAPDGDGTSDAPVDPARRDVRSLDRDRAGRLVTAGLRIADALGGPQDIEWTFRGDQLLLLQARPVTAMGSRSPLGRGRLVWDNSNIQESYNGVTTPLTFSLALRAAAGAYEQALRAVGLPEVTLAQYRPAVSNLIGLVSGRVYYNINNWYRCLLPLPSFGRNKEDMEQMMGLEDPVDFVEGTQLSFADKLRRLPGVLRAGIRMAREFRRLDRSVERFLRRFDGVMTSVDLERVADAPLDELIDLAETLNTEFTDHWVVPVINDTYVMITAGRVRKLLQRSLGEEEARELAAALLSGEEAVASAEPTRRLMKLAQEIRPDAELRRALSEGTPQEALARLCERSPSARTQIDEWIDLYGDRCMGEMKLETISLRQDPTFLVRILRNFVLQPELDPEALDRGEQERRREFERRASTSLGAWRRWRLLRAADRARRGVAARERMRLARTRNVGRMRAVYGAAGERLHEAGLLDEPRDVFYLTAEELSAYRGGTSVTANLAGLARLRKAEYSGYESDELPDHFETIGTPYHGERLAPARAGASGDGRTLHGKGASPGVVEAQLHVVMSPDDDLAVNGKILTTMRTDPGWAPLFPSAAGLLIERGSTLSHSAVLAREFGIPCVVGVPDLLKIVRDGERVRLDGGAGTVQRFDLP